MTKAVLERQLSRAERELTGAKSRLARLRRRLPRTAVEDYSLAGPGGKRLRLSTLFGRHEDRPGVSVLQKGEDGRIFRVAKAPFGPGDDFCSVWHFFDLLPEGVADWRPRFTYQ